MRGILESRAANCYEIAEKLCRGNFEEKEKAIDFYRHAGMIYQILGNEQSEFLFYAANCYYNAFLLSEEIKFFDRVEIGRVTLKLVKDAIEEFKKMYKKDLIDSETFYSEIPTFIFCLSTIEEHLERLI